MKQNDNITYEVERQLQADGGREPEHADLEKLREEIRALYKQLIEEGTSEKISWRSFSRTNEEMVDKLFRLKRWSRKLDEGESR